ncbi:ethanolamine permease [Sciscionella marina]|uniref:ethanolamine permease n=1 Tax=Sciscionella marina TaxID=508770 RepID=UPI00035CCB87|nr:ethanolamine permease [Sciscionella marina]
MDGPQHRSGADFQVAGQDYLRARSLRTGQAGWVLLAGLGIAYVISGNYSGWQFGLALGGWGGLLIATALMAVMYTTMTLGLAELSSALPVAGAGYGFARRALGPLGGFATGAAILIEYAIVPAAISVFIGGYVESLHLFGITNGWPVYLVCYAIFVGVHLRGVGEALRLLLAITVLAILGLVIFAAGMIPHFSPARLFDIPPNGSFGSSWFLPFGVAGILAALVYGIWFFLAVEGLPLAAEEARDPRRDMPRGIKLAMGVLLVLGFAVLFTTAGGGGASVVGHGDNPLPAAARAAAGNGWLATTVNYVGLAGLVASFFSAIYAYSRQLFALSRAGYLPRWLSVTGKRKTPYLALIVPGTAGFLLAALTQDGAKLINIAVFGATVSYVLLNLSHIVLRRKEPGLVRPYRTPGGAVTTSVSMVLAIAAVVATFLVDILAALITAGILLVLIAYFWFYSRHHLVANAPEEEFATLAAAEAELS